MSKKAAKAISATATAAAAITAGLGFAAFKCIIPREPGKLLEIGQKIGTSLTKQAPPNDFGPDDREKWFNEQSFEEFSIKNSRDQLLHAYLLKTDKPSDEYVFCCHGYRSSGKGEFCRMAKFYHDNNINVFMVDHEAAGESEGKYIGFGYYESRDGLQWLDFMLEHFGCDIKIMLHGVSMGSATVMLMSGSVSLPSNVKFTVADCGYTSAWNEFKHELSAAHVPSFPLLQWANFFCRAFAGYDFKDTDALNAVSHTSIPMMFIHGASDDFVPSAMAKELYDACSAPYKDLLYVEGAAHAESYKANSEAYEEKVNGFITAFFRT